MTVGGVEILGGLGVFVEDVLEVTSETVVAGNGASDRGGEEGNVFAAGNISAIGAAASAF